MKNKYAYENLSLKDIPDEQWKAVPGLEDLYEISSFGRIKSLKREMINSNGNTVVVKEKIRKPTVRKLRNHVVNDFKYSLWIVLSNVGGRKTISIGRIVYYTFVEPFDLGDYNYLVSYKDGNGLNVDLENLYLSTISDLGRLSYKLKRNESVLSLKSKPVGQFDISGQLIRQYPSTYQAYKETGFDASSIVSAANGKIQQFRGYIWQYGKRKTLRLGKLVKTKTGSRTNTSLMDKLGISDPQKLRQAVFNLGNEDIIGEQWKDLPGFIGLYRISNYGRVKSVPRLADKKDHRWFPEIIMRINVPLTKTANGEKTIKAATVSLRKVRSYNISISRWVYFLFVAEFNIEDSRECICYKDGDPLNMTFSNLLLGSNIFSFNQMKKQQV